MAFYKKLGLSLINQYDFPDNKFSLYFLAYDSPSAVSHGNHFTDREGIVELTHNYGTENDPDFAIVNGNTEPHRGFGHLAVSVDNIQAACQELEDAGYTFQKKLTDGKMRHIAFVKDPDSYWVEIIPQKPLAETESVKTTDVSTYRLNHSMLRVKSAEASLKFYQETLGMKLLLTKENPNAGFNLYFLGYGKEKGEAGSEVNPLAGYEGILELTWNYGTETEEGPVYHNGNDQPQGFGHICEHQYLNFLSRAVFR